MSQTYEIPLSGQSTTMTISLAGAKYNLAVTWRDAPVEGWFLDIADGSGNPVIGGIAMVPGANLLEQYDYLQLGFGLYVQSDGDPDVPPTYEGFGTTSHLYAVW